MGGRWPDFLQELRLHFQQNALEEPSSGSELLLFSFRHPYSAIVSLFEGMAHLRKEMEWQPDQGALPLQLVLHLGQQEGGEESPLTLPPEGWERLAPEALHITRPLKMQWDRLMAGRTLAPLSFAPGESGLFQVSFPEGVLASPERLFAWRELPRTGSLQECFYCSQTHHEPALCPSKLLAPQMQGLSLAGYLPFAQLNELFKKAVPATEELMASLQAGLKSSQIRQAPLLQILLAYFDLYRIYQPRFLHRIAFSFFTNWEGLGRSEHLKIDNRTLHLGLDCLRVGQYSQANQLFTEESLRHGGNHFCAMVGQAFRSIEQGRESDAESYLKKASHLAEQEKEKVYIGLLLSRYHELRGDKWSAEHALDGVLSLNRTCPEASYRQCQLLAEAGAGEQAMAQLRHLIGNRRELFMTALLDPALAPVQGLVEDLLFSHYHALVREAGETLEKARVECQELRGWFEEDTPELESLLAMLATLEQQQERGSYFDLLDVAAKAERLYYDCHQVREAKLDELKKRLGEESRRRDGFRDSWQRYPYPLFFKSFEAGLAASRTLLEEAVALAKEVRGDAYRAAEGKLKAATAELDTLQPRLSRMMWVKIAMDGARSFCRKLLLTELILCALGGLLLIALSQSLTGPVAGIPPELLTEPWFIRQSFWVLTVLLAPLIALALTLWQIKE